MILNFIASKNVHRRQLNPGQRAGVAEEYERFYAAAIREGERLRKLHSPSNQHTAKGVATKPDPAKSQHEGSPPDTKGAAGAAAKATGASATAVKQMKALKRDAPDLHGADRPGCAHTKAPRWWPGAWWSAVRFAQGRELDGLQQLTQNLSGRADIALQEVEAARSEVLAEICELIV